MTTRLLTLVLAAMVGSALLFGCGDGGTTPAPKPPAKPAAKGKVVIGVSLLTLANPFFKEIGDWRWLLRGEEAEDVLGALPRHGRTGRPLGSPRFLEWPENRLRRLLRGQKPGPKPKGDK